MTTFNAVPADFNFRASNAASTNDLEALFTEIVTSDRNDLSYADFAAIARKDGLDEVSQALGRLEDLWMELEQ